MSNLKKNVLTLLVSLTVVAISAFLIYPPATSTKLGLDLKGGLSVVMQAVPTKKAPVTEESLNQAMLIINQRVNKLGVAEPDISRQGKDSILIQLPGVKDPQKALEIIGQTAVLEFALLDPAYESASEEDINKAIKDKKRVLQPSLLGGNDLASARASYGGATGLEAIVDMKFKSAGAEEFGKITSANVGKRLAIVLDGAVMSAPSIQQGIFGGQAQITGLSGLEEAKSTALVLQTGALPVKLEPATVKKVGPTLGQESLEAGLLAMGVGFALVALYMLFYYSLLGFVTWFGLAVFFFTFWGVVAALGRYDLINLTLPGIAGVVLTIGVAADSKIIIYERIKEEIRAGRTFRTAIDSGFWHAFRTILDADGVTFLTASILFWLGVGPVKGFALMLMMGIMIDMFAFALFTRPVLGILAHYPALSKPSMIGLRKRQMKKAA